MIRTAEQLALFGAVGHGAVSIRCAGAGDVKFVDHLQKKHTKQLGFLPLVALESKIERGQVSIAFENDEPAAYLLGNGGYLGDGHFGIIYQAAVSYDARRRLMGTALVQHFVDHMEPTVRLVGLWCAQDIEANEFWRSCGFEAVAARHGSRKKRRVHIFWVGRTARGRYEEMRFPRSTRGGLMRERREVFEIAKGAEYSEIELGELVGAGQSADEKSVERALPAGRGGRHQTLAEQQRAFRYGGGEHICVVLAGVTRYLPVAPFEVPVSVCDGGGSGFVVRS